MAIKYSSASHSAAFGGLLAYPQQTPNHLYPPPPPPRPSLFVGVVHRALVLALVLVLVLVLALDPYRTVPYCQLIQEMLQLSGQCATDLSSTALLNDPYKEQKTAMLWTEQVDSLQAQVCLFKIFKVYSK